MTTVNVTAMPIGEWRKDWVGTTYSTGHDASTADWVADPNDVSAANNGVAYYANYTIERALFYVDLTDVPLAADIDSATLKTYHCWAYVENCKVGCAICEDMDVIIVDGTNVPQDDTGYGVMLGRTTSCGSITISNNTYTEDTDYTFTLNAAGIAVLEANLGSYAYFGVRIDSDINNVAQCGYHWWTFKYDEDAVTEVEYPALMSFTFPDLLDYKGRAVKNAVVDAHSTSAHKVVETQRTDANGQANFTALPYGEDIVFHATYSGVNVAKKEEWFTLKFNEIEDGGTGEYTAAGARDVLGVADSAIMWEMVIGD